MKKIIIILSFLSLNLIAQEEAKPKEKKLDLDQKILTEVDPKVGDTLFKNMVVVQKKAIEKKGRFLFDAHFSFDYSDTPKTMTGVVLGVGYSINDSFEIGGSITPFFMSKEKSDLANNLDMAAPKLESSIYLNWFFMYGKEAYGPYRILRSDTFLKFFYSKIQYEDSFSGARLGFYVGKDYYWTKNMVIRLAFGLASQESFINQVSHSSTVALFEPGLVYFF
jgi:hypothetical protein